MLIIRCSSLEHLERTRGNGINKRQYPIPSESDEHIKKNFFGLNMNGCGFFSLIVFIQPGGKNRPKNTPKRI